VTGASLSGSMFALVSPAMQAVFALAFFCAWLFDRKRTHLLIFAGSITALCLAVTTQILSLPPDPGHNAMVSAVLYTFSALSAIEAVLRRSGKRLPWVTHLVAGIFVVSAMAYFYYVTPSLVTRVYIQDFGYGSLMLYAAIQLTQLRKGKPIDRVVFWVFTVFALHFFPRTIVTLALTSPDNTVTFANPELWFALHISLVVLGAVLAFTMLAAAMIDRMDDIRADRDADQLTGLLNRRGFDDKGRAFIANPAIQPVSMIVCDIDYFKSVNDTFGHAEGDHVLQAFATILANTIRVGDIAARVGGEEFVILLHSTEAEEARAIADRIRVAFATQRPVAETGPARVTASFGVAQARPGEPLWQIVKRADSMLYAAKSEGRNAVVVWDNRTEEGLAPPLVPVDDSVVIPIRKRSGDIRPGNSGRARGS
jgi:diguanylate cyclase (GGDEF)-like protein